MYANILVSKVSRQTVKLEVVESYNINIKECRQYSEVVKWCSTAFTMSKYSIFSTPN